MIDRPVVSVIVVSYNNVDLLVRLLRSLSAVVTNPAIEIIVVDNASAEPVVSTVRAAFGHVKLLPQEKNRGFAGGCNVGAAAATGDYLLFVNSDVELLTNPVPEMVSVMETEKSVAVVGCELWNSDGSPQPTAFRFPSLWMRSLQLSGLKDLLVRLLPGARRSYGRRERPDFLSGAFLMVRADDFRRVGGFDERYFMYLEDADLAFRFQLDGMHCRLIASRGVIHHGQHYEFLANPRVTMQMNVGLVMFYAKNHGRWRLRIFASVSWFLLSLRWMILRGPGRREVASLLRLYAKCIWNPSSMGGDAGNRNGPSEAA